MRGHTAKFLRKAAPLLELEYRELKRDWIASSHKARAAWRVLILRLMLRDARTP